VTTSEERKALNEGVFRRANEEVEAAAVELKGPRPDADADPVPFICECPQPDCRRVVLLTLAEYERVRSDGRYGLAFPGHEDAAIERVLERNDRFVMTEKFGAAGAVHDEADPRDE
jgi:hypothetical protein